MLCLRARMLQSLGKLLETAEKTAKVTIIFQQPSFGSFHFPSLASIAVIRQPCMQLQSYALCRQLPHTSKSKV
jgi:hypothetical protein